MIVTRQRRKPFPWRRVLLPVAAAALLAVALWWTPSRTFVVNGPLAPVLRAVSPAWNSATAPLHFEAQNKVIGEQTQKIAALQKQLDAASKQTADRDKQVSALQTQVNDAQQQLALRPAPAASAPAKSAAQSAAAGAAAPPGAAAPAGSDLGAGATPDMRRTAQVWAAMDAEAAAKVVQRLPVAYVARVFAVMAPDSVGPILEAVPPAYAAQLTREHPELQR